MGDFLDSLLSLNVTSSTGAIGFVVFLLLLVIFLAKSYRRVVEPNEVHIVQSRRGTRNYGKQKEEDDTGTWPGNSYYKWPHWWPIIGVQRIVLPLSVFDQKLINYEAYDIGKVPFVVDVVAFFRINKPTVAAKRILDLHELKAQLESILQGAVRTILAKHEIEDIMMERSTFGKMFTDEVADQLVAWGVVNVKNIELMDIRDGRDSKTVSNIMAKKESVIDRESRVVVAENTKLAETAEIEAKQMVDVRAQAAEETVGLRTAQKNQAVGIADEKAMQEIKTQARETAERDMAVKQVEDVRAAEISRNVEVVKADEDKRTTVIRAEGDREREIIEAEAVKQKTIIIAEGDLQDSLKDAEGILAVGTSNAEAKRLEEMATVSPQIALADEIGSNDGYQSYLIKIRDVEKNEAVGIEQAKALQAAGIKVIVNSGDVQGGMDNLLDVLSTKGGTNIAGMLEALKQTDVGKSMLEKAGIEVKDS
ncbi:MAG: SPFH domain-containing protein [Pseudomonadota bacterium]